MIETDRLLLRPWRHSDCDPLHRITSDPRGMEFYPTVLTRGHADAFVAPCQTHQVRHAFTFFAAELRETGEMIGFIGLAHTPFEAHFTPCVEIGWRFGFEHWNRGLATEGARGALRYGFEQLRLDEIVALTVPMNLRSRRVMEKLGMTSNPAGDFDYPGLPVGHLWAGMCLYRVRNSNAR